MTNAERAAAAEQAVLCYLTEKGIRPNSDHLSAIIADLLCDLRHLARFTGVPFKDDTAHMAFDAERNEDADGEFEAAPGLWVLQ